MTNYSLFPSDTGPASVFNDGTTINVGTIVRVSAPMWVTHSRFWLAGVSAGIYGTVTGQVWQSNSGDPSLGTKLAQKAFSGLVLGWNVVELDDPVPLVSGETYLIGHHCSTGNYTATSGFWAPGGPGSAGIPAGAMVAPHKADAPLLEQSRFIIGSGSIDTFPNDGFGGGNYWSDAIVTDVDPSIPTGPTVQKLVAGEWIETDFVRRFNGTDWVEAEVQVIP